MFEKKDYTNLTLEELLVEEKKIMKNKIFSAVLIGCLIGVLIYSLVKNGFSILPIAIPTFLIATIYKSSQVQKQNLERIQAEIKDKSTNKN